MSHLDYSNIGTSFTLTFSDRIGNNPNYGEIGTEAPFGFTNDDIIRIYHQFSDRCELHNLKDMLPPTLQEIPDVYFLIIKNFYNDTSNQLLQILMTNENTHEGAITGVNWDTENFKNGKLKKNKQKYKLIFSDLYDGYKRNSSLQNEMCTVYNYMRIPQLLSIKYFLESILQGPFVIEGSCFYNTKECYVPMHREKEKKKLIGLHLGNTFPINFRWYHNTIHCSTVKTIQLNHGDIYIMSELATGNSKEKLTKLFIKHSEGTHGNCLK